MKARLIAYYLPQFHPIEENDAQWGKGFTEWTNVAKAKPLFKEHYQPFLPTELGYYDLRLPEVRKAQADLAREHGIEGFCYWHYWFGNGKRLLEMPFDEVVKTGEPDFPFCLCWANHSWTATWTGNTKRMIQEQTYPGLTDFEAHFYSLLSAFKDKRYIKISEKLLYLIYAPTTFNCKAFTDAWQQLAIKEGLPGFHFVAMGVDETNFKDYGLSGFTPLSPHPIIARLPIKFKDKITYRLFGRSFSGLKAFITKQPIVYQYEDFVDRTIIQNYDTHEYPIALPNWDHSPRSANRGFVLQGSTPKLFRKIVKHCIGAVKNRDFEERVIFLKAWNEWAEGNFLEPEAKFGRGYLEVVKEENTI